jgi:glycosidase
VEFWAWVIPQVKARFPHLIFVAEAYNPAVYRSYLDFGHFDYLYDKVGMYDTLRNITSSHEPARRISVMWQRVNDILPKMLFFLENHDEQRIASRFFAGDARKALPAMIVTAALSTSVVMVYAGQELGEPAADAEGFSGDDGRTSIFDYWSVNSLRCWYNKGKCDGALLTKEQQELRDFYQQLLNISLQEKAIREGEMFDLMYINCNNPRFNPDRQFAYLRKAGDELLLICVNFADTAAEVAVNIPKHAFDYLALTDNVRISSRDLLTGKDDQQQMLSSECPFVVKLEKYSGKILKIKQVILTTKDH